MKKYYIVLSIMISWNTSIYAVDVIKKEYPELTSFLESSEFNKCLGNVDLNFSNSNSYDASTNIALGLNGMHYELKFSRSLLDRKKLSAEEFKFILCHELGHYNDSDIVQNSLAPSIIWALGTMGGCLYSVQKLIKNRQISSLFFTSLFSIIGLASVQYLQRKGEYYADGYALKITQNKKAAESVLKKRYFLQEKQNESCNEYVQRIKNLFKDHPSAQKRIMRLL